MIKFLLHRPIAVFMAFTACFIIGIVTYKTLPISLLPDIAIPEITVQVTGENTSARELENTVMRTLRSQLMQVGRLEDLRSETRDGIGLIRLRFEYGTNTDLAFIEVNEKTDAAMSYLPRNTQRPKVIKASATDIPVLYLNLTATSDELQATSSSSEWHSSPVARSSSLSIDFLSLSDFAENVVRRRIEQLPEVAMVDISGLAHQQVQIVPDLTRMEAMGIGVGTIESALASSNVEPGSMTVRDGYYEYNIRFSTIVRTVEDVKRIPIRHEGRIMTLGELADVRMTPTEETGMTTYNGKRTVSLAIIKQADENMDKMKSALNGAIWSLKQTNPHIQFDIIRNQTELLDYTLTNLQQNLALGFLFILIVASLFMGGVRSPLVIGVCMVVALVISFIFFYLFGMSLNIISLSGLILAEGMMIDNAIIVTENIAQYREKGYTVEEACQLGTEEVITPMLSSSLTTIAVFIPLVFISGIAGAIFMDEAFAVTVGLVASYITGIILLPVLYKIVFGLSPLPLSVRKGNRMSNKVLAKLFKSFNPQSEIGNISLPSLTGRGKGVGLFYDRGIHWVFSHKGITWGMVILSIPLCVVMFYLMPKERMPETSRTELAVRIDWNENIHIDDNRRRTEELEQFCREQYAVKSQAHIGTRQYLLEREQTTSTETDLYLCTASADEPAMLQNAIGQWIETHYPEATVHFYSPENVFEKVFDTNEPELVVEIYHKDKEQLQAVEQLQSLQKKMDKVVDESSEELAIQEQIELTIDRERLLLYGVSYDEILRTLKTALRENKVATLRSYQSYLLISISGREQTLDEILTYTLVEIPSTARGERQRVPLKSFITTSPSQGLKTITAGMAGEYVPLTYADTKQAGTIVEKVKEVFRPYPSLPQGEGVDTSTDDRNVSINNKKEDIHLPTLAEGWSSSFSGAFYTSHRMIDELTVVLFISLLLMYFILAAQFESFLQPLIVLAEIPIDLGFALVVMAVCGISLNLMSAIGIVVSCGIIINDSILKLDMINVLRKEGVPLMEAIHTAGTRRLRSIIMTSLTTILAMVPLLFTHDLGSELQAPLAIAMIATMSVGTLVSLFVIPLVYWGIYRGRPTPAPSLNGGE